MSIKRARKYLQKDKRDGHVLLDFPDHRQFLKYLTGRDCFEDMVGTIIEAVHKLDVDILMGGAPSNQKSRGELEDNPNLYGSDLTVWRNSENSSRDISEHDPLAKRQQFNTSDDNIARMFIEQDARSRFYAGGTALTHGGYYTTCFHYAAEDLDYEEFLCFCVQEPERTAALLDRYEALSTRVLTAWRRCNIEVMLCHDDIANAKSLTLNPDYIRENLIPRYKRLFAPFNGSGIPLLFLTDGNFTEIARDILEAGADGFFLDRPAIDPAALIKRCGDDKFYYTGPSPEMMTNGTPGDIEREMDMLSEIADSVPGFMFHMPGGWTRNMPMENVKTFYKRIGRI